MDSQFTPLQIQFQPRFSESGILVTPNFFRLGISRYGIGYRCKCRQRV